MNLKGYIAAFTLAAIMLPSVSFAQTSSIDSLLAQIKALQAQILELSKKKEEIEKQSKDLRKQTQELKKESREQAAELRRTLREGSEGDDVKVLQALLAADPDIYPEALISGFFGKKTAQAVKRFQKKYGLDQVGHVGPKTLKELQKLLGNHPIVVVNNDGTSTNATSTSTQLCTFIPPGHLIAPGWNKNKDKHKKKDKWEDSDSLIPFCKTIPPGIWEKLTGGNWPPAGTTTPPVADTATPILTLITATDVTTSGAKITWVTNEAATTQVEYGPTTSYGSITSFNSALVTTHNVTLAGLANNTTFHYRVLSKDAAGNLATSGDFTFTTGSTDGTAPTISSITASAITANSATIGWTTNEGATTQVEYGPTTSYGNTTSLSTALITSHNVILTGLSTSTTYHFRVMSKDAANNLATSGDQSFTTATPADTTAPVISGTVASAIASTSVTIAWNTDEAATGKVYYGTVNPLVLGSASAVQNASLVTGHSFGLTGLTASTTYYYVVESKDAANNTATGTQGSFTTAQ